MTQPDRYELYERCAQSAPDLAGMLVAMHGGAPTVLGEDFCGTAAVARAWIELVEGGRAIVVDHDAEPLERVSPQEAIRVIRGDVIEATDDAMSCDVVHAGNFSIGEWATREQLIAYLHHVRCRLRDDGVFVCDVYGGESAFQLGTIDRAVPLPDGRIVEYVWEQRMANPVTGRVVNAMHFRIKRGDVVEHALDDAFVYDWRLWSLTELQDAFDEAGYGAVRVFDRVPDAVDEAGRAYVTPLTGDGDVEENFDVFVAAWPGLTTAPSRPRSR